MKMDRVESRVDEHECAHRDLARDATLSPFPVHAFGYIRCPPCGLGWRSGFLPASILHTLPLQITSPQQLLQYSPCTLLVHTLLEPCHVVLLGTYPLPPSRPSCVTPRPIVCGRLNCLSRRFPALGRVADGQPRLRVKITFQHRI